MTKRSVFAAGLALALPFGLAACGGGKPSKDEVLDGMSSMMEEQFESMGTSTEEFESMGITQETFDEYYSCIVDDIYDDVSDDTLQKIADGDAEGKISSDDQSALQGATTNCMSTLGL